MISKETYTKIFLKQLGQSTDAATVAIHLHKWWMNNRTKQSGGLRLTDEGYSDLISKLELKDYEVPFTQPIELSPQTILFFDRYLDCPYYLTNKSVTVFSEKRHFELYMFAEDIRKYGLMKAINARNADKKSSPT